MSDRLAYALLRLVAAVGVIVTGYVVLADWMRRFEAATATTLVRAGGSNRVLELGNGSILIEPRGRGAFIATVTASCSSISSILALSCLAALARRGSRRRRLGALACTIAIVVGANILRIAASIEIGLVAGRDSLVLFHDFVGSVMTFASILAGFIMMLYLLLPDRRAEVTVSHA
jgi:carbamoyl-phosphate synthase large subunit